MILAAGRGTRLGALGLRIPKILLDVGGEPLLTRHFRYLEREGVKRVVVNTHHRAEDVRRFVDAYCGPLDVVLISEPLLLGTAGGVRNALPHLGRGPFLVLYGDVLIEEPLAPLLDAHVRRRAAATLTVYEAPSTVGKGVVLVADDWRVLRFVEKRQEGPGLVNAGLYVLERGLVAALPAGIPLDFGHDVLPAAVARGDTIVGYRLSRAVTDIGTPEALQLARDALARPQTREARERHSPSPARGSA